ncbi:MAG: hypothetical protein ACLQBD_31765 [Syntrophobacteraceae bacterium]
MKKRVKVAEEEEIPIDVLIQVGERFSRPLINAVYEITLSPLSISLAFAPKQQSRC